jgi:pyruvate,water dikinase
VTPAVAGGKGANLARLAGAGLPVPPGFLITTAALHDLLGAAGLGERIAAACRAADAGDPASFGLAAQAVGRLLDQVTIPHQLAEEVVEGYRQLTLAVAASACDAGRWGGPAAPWPRAARTPRAPRTRAGLLPVAVRSSGTAEDLPEASFAGQHETCLNVRGEAALLAAVRRCWHSLWSERALAYRARRGYDPAAVGLAVVVQQMVPATAAGVLLTVNPLSGDRDEAVLNAAWGLGKAVVDGLLTPDTVVVRRSTGRILSAVVGDKAVETTLTEEGTAEVAVAARRRRRAVLRPPQIAELIRLGDRTEACFGVPQDIEWAIAGERTWVVQARPATALPRAGPAPAAGDDDWPVLDERPATRFDLWTQTNVGEVWPHPVTPLTASGAPAIVGGGVRYALRGLDPSALDGIQWAKRFYGRIYYNEGALAHLLAQQLGLPATFIDGALGSRRGAGARLADDGLRPLRLLARLPFLVRSAYGQMSTGRELEKLFALVDRWVAEFQPPGLEPLSDAALWAEHQRWVERFMRVMTRYTEMSGASMAAYSLLERLTVRWCGHAGLARDLISGLAGIHAAEMGNKLWQLAAALRRLGLDGIVLGENPGQALHRLREAAEAGPVLALLDSFLDSYGHRCFNEGEWLHPRWAEAPEQVLEVVAGYLRSGGEGFPRAGEARRRREEAMASTAGRLGSLRRPAFHRLLTRTQHLVRLRDNGKHYYMKVSFPLRRIHALLGRRWTARGWLEQPADIFFLTIPDLERVIAAGSPRAAGVDPSSLVSARRRAFDGWFDVDAPDVIGPEGRAVTVASVPPVGGRVLAGVAAGSGQARGPARIIHAPHEAGRLQPGDVLVIRATDPGWTVIFPLLGGLVVEVGGQLSHAAIAAREYGLPAVVNVRDATHRLRDGEIITVDGSAGWVRCEESREPGGPPDG